MSPLRFQLHESVFSISKTYNYIYYRHSGVNFIKMNPGFLNAKNWCLSGKRWLFQCYVQFKKQILVLTIFWPIIRYAKFFEFSGFRVILEYLPCIKNIFLGFSDFLNQGKNCKKIQQHENPQKRCSV